MRSASSTEITEEIQNRLISSNAETIIKLEIYVNDTPQILNDLDEETGIDWTESGKKNKSFAQTLTPLAGEISFQVYNENGKYSVGSGTAFEDIIDNETKFRLSAGYRLNELKAETSESISLNNVSGFDIFTFYYHTKFNNPYVDLSSASSIPTHFTDLTIPLYDSETYDDSTYALDAYNVQTYDTGGPNQEQINKFDITTNNTEGTIYWRVFDSPEDINNSTSNQWTNAGSTTNGTSTIIVDEIKRYLQVAVIYDGITYTDDLRITDITVYTQSFVEFIYKSIYYLDTPDFDDPQEPEIPKIYCKGRDVWKRAINNELNIEDLSSSPVKPDVLAKSIAGKVNIPYTSASIDDLSSFSSITWADGLGDVKDANDIFELIMQKIVTTGYQMYTKYVDSEDENVLFITQEPSTLEANGAFSYKNYVQVGNTRKNNDKMLQRISIISDQQVVDAEDQLKQTAFTTTGIKSMTWTGNAIYKNIAIDLPDNITIIDLTVSPAQIDFEITEITGTVTITVTGNKWRSTEPTYQGEAISLDNMINGKGSTSRIVNPLFISNDECKTAAEQFITNFTVPVLESQGLQWPYLNLLPEINDVYLLWRRFYLDDNLYFITGISHHWDRAETPSESTNFNLDDSGRNFSETSSYTYDDTPTPMKYDTGFLYDMGISTPLSTDAEIDASSIIIHNVDTI
jgi:hypothetical protein